MKFFKIIVEAFACIQYLKNQQTESGPKEDNGISPEEPKIPKPAALCLIVPAAAVVNLKKNNRINVSEIKGLISSAIYILCASPEKADDSQKRLELAGEDISNASENTEVYVRIDISDGEEMIGETIPYNLKSNLPPNERYEVTELACLEYLSNSGLKNFHRV